MFSFRLADSFVSEYKNKEVNWGYADAGGTALGEISFVRTYSRLKADGTKERWWEVCERVINGMFSIQKDYAKQNKLPWSNYKAQKTAQDAFDRLFEFKWTPPGRGLWVMGTPLVNEHKNSAALQNCSFISTYDMTREEPAEPFLFLMEASMLGVGVGFDTRGVEKKFKIYEPKPIVTDSDFPVDPKYVVPDSREGWVESLKLLLESYLKPGKSEVFFDYSEVRPAGSPIKIFGGTSAGHEPLERLHKSLRELLNKRVGKTLATTDIADIGNLIGVCVVSGNVRRSAELLMGSIHDDEFLALKDYGHTEEETYEVKFYRDKDTGFDLSPEFPVDADIPFTQQTEMEGFENLELHTETRTRSNWVPGPAAERITEAHPGGWSWMSNNSVSVNVGDDLSKIAPGIAQNGEPGVIWMDVSRQYGRLADPINNKDHRVAGYNPCFHPDTIIETVDGPQKIVDITAPTLVYTCDHDGKLSARKSSAAFLSRKNANTIRIGLRNGDELIVTPEHKIMLRGGEWVEAQELVVGSSLETLNRTRRGWRYSGVRLASQNTTEQVMEHRMIWEAVYGPIPEGFDVDHINKDHHDNRIENLQLLSHSEHAKLSRSQVPNNHQIHAANGDFAPGGKRGKKDAEGAINPPRATGWVNQKTVTYIKEGPVTDVYDITVDDTHCMIANGVVAHNCAEQSLESGEMCTLVETYIEKHDTIEDYKKTLKVAYLYGKTVTLLPTHWQKTNAIMQRNRRIGTSMSGIADFADNRGIPELRKWMDEGYLEIQRLDKSYSEWLCVRESIKTTTVKPSGTVSILAGVSPGVHWSPGGKYFLRTIRFGKDDPMVTLFKNSGYTVEVDQANPESTVVVYFPIKSNAKNSEKDITLFEKAALAATAQRWWSDNSVSVTLSFDPETEGQHVAKVLAMYEGQLKTVSFLPMLKDGAYAQMPYGRLSQEDWTDASRNLLPIDLNPIYDGTTESLDAVGEAYCVTDACVLEEFVLNAENNQEN